MRVSVSARVRVRAHARAGHVHVSAVSAVSDVSAVSEVGRECLCVHSFVSRVLNMYAMLCVRECVHAFFLRMYCSG